MFKRSFVFHGVLPLPLSTSLVYHSCPQSKLSDLSSLSTNVFSITHRCQATSLLKTTISEALISSHHTATTMQLPCKSLVCVGSLFPSTGGSTCKPCKSMTTLAYNNNKKNIYPLVKNILYAKLIYYDRSNKNIKHVDLKINKNWV